MKDQRWLTTEEDHAIARALSTGLGGFTDEEFATAIRWAESIRIRHACLELVLQGLVSIRPQSDEDIRMYAIGPHPDDLVEDKGAE